MTSCKTNEIYQAEYSLPDRPFIGVLDSGVGGLSVQARFLESIPQEDYVYVGDSCHAPYGDRSPAELFELSGSISLWLKDKGAKAIALACNTISSTLITEIRSLLAPLPVYSILEAGVTAAVKYTKTNKIGIIATAATTKSRTFEKGIKKYLPDAKIISVACPAFVPLVEKGLVSSPAATRAVKEICSLFSDKDIDTLLLGCTHYPALIPLLRKYLPDYIEIVDPAAHYAGTVAADLEQMHNLPEKLPGGNLSSQDLHVLDPHSEILTHGNTDKHEIGKMILLTTGDPIQFKESGVSLFGRVPEPVFILDNAELKTFSPLNTVHGRALAEQIAK